MKFFMIFIYIFYSFKLTSAEFTYEAMGKEQRSDIIKSPNGETIYMLYTNTAVYTSNTKYFGPGICSGIQKVENGLLNADILCENKSGKYLWYPVFNVKNLDPADTTSVINFDIKHGTGPFTELIGVKCTAAYVPIQDNHFLYKAKCNVPDASFERMLNFKDN